MKNEAFHDIPGTTLFDSAMSRKGYHLNMFLMSLMKPENRARFKTCEMEYLDGYPMTQPQKEAVAKRQWNEMLNLGGNVYYTAKLAATDGIPVAHMSAAMAGLSPTEYVKMMINGGRKVDGNRSKGD
jgi:protocatechuate 4,5-dioxygenase alpha chain